VVITIPLVLLLAAALAALLRFRALGAGAAVVAALFGFYLAATDASDTVNQLVTAVTAALADIGR
jgi:3-polyprenyl-4-hydroxybenzoate decarboxylase